MDYNTQRPTLLMPEYGRIVQQMVDDAMKIPDRAQRQAYAEAIIGVMRGLNPQMKNVPGYREKLWDHLAYISNYQLDIDYPCEIHRAEANERPNIPYPTSTLHYRHYGTLVERALNEMSQMPDNAQRTELLRGIGTRMKRCIVSFRGEQPDDKRIVHDIERITQGATRADFGNRPLASIRVETSTNNTKKRKKK